MTQVLQTLVALAAVCALAWIVLRALSLRGVGVKPRGTRELEVLEQLPLGPRRSLYVVRAGDKRLVIGLGEQGAPVLIAELEPKPSEPHP
jgi:flagellar protein FliO/FliZ